MSDVEWLDSLEAAKSAAAETDRRIVTYVHAPG